ncbi:hypothetical protein PAN31117_04039 [Pandoraea anapnoica]|uniref:Uncharacterized protein n=1 Tax=Pandoraea anapnoica TaxID=2508301 RepID=A0A5E5ACT9_9BURK|nr:hypothetical protein [Pandoraea anapnoica]VVE71414.1 hypothetical protein PAN31117_04039 [Pandoraea anapnoica]
MNTIRRSGLSADAFCSLSERSPSHRHDTAAVSQGRNNGRADRDERDEQAFALRGEPAACVTGPADVLRWLRVWHTRQDANWDSASVLRVVVHGGALDTLVVEARRGRQGITVSLLCARLTMYRRLLAHRGKLSRTLTSRFALPVTVEVEARYVP